MKILIFGASGSGTTTLGNEIERQTDFVHLDVDDYYWKPTTPPFQEKVSLAERNEQLTVDFRKQCDVVVSGSMVSWGKEWETAFDLAIFLRMNDTLRMERLERREVERYGDALISDEKIQQNSEAFLAWAQQYENPSFTGRSLKIHTDWMKLLDCKVLQLDGALPLNKKFEMVKFEIENDI